MANRDFSTTVSFSVKLGMIKKNLTELNAEKDTTHTHTHNKTSTSLQRNDLIYSGFAWNLVGTLTTAALQIIIKKGFLLLFRDCQQLPGHGMTADP